jgi:CHASE2 domain-containing sensor protein
MDRTPIAQELAESVVLIGDTRSTSHDHHWTAIGAVSGAEIHLNDIRQFSMMKPAPDTLGDYLASEMPLLMAGFFAVLLVEIWLSFRRNHKPGLEKTSFRYLVSVFWSLLLIGLVLTIVAAAFMRLHDFHGRVPDIVTPFVALFLFTATESLCRLVMWIEARLAPDH